MSLETKKPHINIGTVGHVDHGKTTFTAAVTNVLSKAYGHTKVLGYDNIDKAPEEKKRGITINATTIQYETDALSYAHVDCPGHMDFVKNMIVGSSRLDWAVLIVSACDGLSPQTKEHVLLMKQLGIKHIAIFFTKMDLVPAEDMWLVEEVKDEVIKFLNKHGYNGPFVIGYGAPAKILEYSTSASPSAELKEKYDETFKAIVDFYKEIEATFPLPHREIDKPALLAVESSITITGRGTVATGSVIQGVVGLNEEVEIYGGDKPMKSVVIGIESFHKKYERASAGENVGVLLRGLTKDQVERGYLICAPGSMKTYSYVRVVFTFLSKEEGGRGAPVFVGYRPQFYYLTADYTCVFHAIKSKEGKFVSEKDSGVSLIPGIDATNELVLRFEKNVPMFKDCKFTLREGNLTIGGGTVLSVGNTYEEVIA